MSYSEKISTLTEEMLDIERRYKSFDRPTRGQHAELRRLV